MKNILRWLAVITVAIGLQVTNAMAGDCCKQAAKNVRAGKACEKCLEHKCCKDTAKTLAKKAKAKPCEKCAAKAKQEKKS